MPEATQIRASVVYAEPGCVFNVEVALSECATIADAIEASGFRQAHPDVVLRDGHVGVFARKAKLSTRLRDGDRVEIYRPLRLDPKEARRRRAKRA